MGYGYPYDIVLSLKLTNIGELATYDSSLDEMVTRTSVEIAIDDQSINNFAGADDYDEECMLKLLRATPAYRTLFEYCFPLNRFLSLTTIYNIHSTT